MKRSLSHGSIIVLAAVSLILQSPRIAFSRDSATDPELNLLVYNYAALSSSQVTEIRARVAFIFEQAGIQTKWWDCRPVLENHPAPATCQQPLGPGNLAIRLLDQINISQADYSHTALGLSYVSETGGSLATLSCATIKRLARGNRTSELAFQGHAIAHEIGHLLLGPGAHSNEGIMRALWNKSELQQIAAAQQGLLFPRKQAEQLRMSLSARQGSPYASQ